MKSIQKGFTLIELMIVVAIIAILAAIAIPAYQDYVIRSQVSEGMSLSDGAKTAVAEFYANKGHYPSINESAGLADSGSIIGKYVSDLDVSGGVIVTKFAGPEANDKLNSVVLAFSPFDEGGSTSWNCKTDASGATVTNIPEKYLPAACRP